MSPMFSHTVHSLLLRITSTVLPKQLTDTAIFRGAAGQKQRGVFLLWGQRDLAPMGHINRQVGNAGDV